MNVTRFKWVMALAVTALPSAAAAEWTVRPAVRETETTAQPASMPVAAHEASVQPATAPVATITIPQPRPSAYSTIAFGGAMLAADDGAAAGCGACGAAAGCGEAGADPCTSCSTGDGCDSCGTSCESCDSGCGCAGGEGFSLFSCPDAGIVIGGWTSQSIFFNAAHPVDKFNGPVTFNDRDREYQLNQQYLYFDKAVDTGGEGFDWGARVDALYGTDWRFTWALGLEVNKDGTMDWNQDHRFYGAALPQLYAAFGFNDLTVKLGHFYTIIGYEVVTAPDNFFSTHAYTMQYGEPFTHTGALASYALTETIALSSGLHRGWDAWEDPDNNLGYLGGITWTPTDVTSVAWACTWSDELALGPTSSSDRFMYSLVISRSLFENLTYIFQHDLGHQNDAFGVGQNAEWYGINQYLIYDINDVWAIGMRGEWFRDDDGYRVAGLGSVPGNDFSGAPFGRGPAGFTGSGYAGNFYEISLGINAKPNANVIWRNECRWDWYDGADGFNANPSNGPLPYDDGNQDDQFMVGTNLIVTY